MSHIFPRHTKAPPPMVATGEGCYLIGADGKRYFDGSGGAAVSCLGHGDPAVTEAIVEQVRKLAFAHTGFFTSEPAEALADKLIEHAPDGLDRVYLVSGGSEAVEAALKLARYVTGKHAAIAFYGAFHGRTYGAVSLTASKAKYHRKFGPLLPGIYHAPYGDGYGFGVDIAARDGRLASIAYIEDVLFKQVVSPDDVAAIFVEPVQGEGGYIVPPKEFLQELRRICDEHCILLVADEVQSGMGRTGKTWAIQNFDVEPDLMCIGKGIASGMPLGALMAKADLMKWGAGAHGSTYGGSPTCCAAALATIDLVENGMKQNAAEVGAHMIAALKELQSRHDVIRDVRGLGMMIGVEFVDHDLMARIEQEGFKRGLLLLGCGDSVIRMAPPLLMTRAQVDRAMQVLDEVLTAVSG